MKNLCSTIREMAEQPVEKDIKQTFHGTLTEMARQVTDGGQLDELSKKTLGSYIKKAALQAKLAGTVDWTHTSPHAQRAAKRLVAKRNKGISRATDLVGSILEAMSRKDKKINRNRTLRKNREAAKSYVPSEAAKKESDALYRRVTGKPPVNEESTEEAMKRLAAKALNRARKKAGKSSTEAKGVPSENDLRTWYKATGANPPAEGMIPTYKNLKRMYKKAKAQQGKASTDDQYAGSKPKAGKSDPDMKNARHAKAIAEVAAPGYEDWASDPKVKASFKKQYGKRWKQVMYGRSWNMKKMDEETELAEGVSAKRMRILRKYVKGNKRVPEHLMDYMDRSFKKKRLKDKQLSDGRGAVGALETRMRRKAAAKKAKGLAEDTLEEGILKKLRRAKGAAYAAMQGGEGDKYARLHKVASGLQSRHTASMARRGGASPEAVKGAGSLLGKSGDYTLKAGRLSRQHDNAVRKFQNTAWEKRYGSGSEAVTTGYGMFNKNAATKRKNQQAQAEFANKARSGDFGQDNQAALRARSNFQKRYGRLKGK